MFPAVTIEDVDKAEATAALLEIISGGPLLSAVDLEWSDASVEVTTAAQFSVPRLNESHAVMDHAFLMRQASERAAAELSRGIEGTLLGGLQTAAGVTQTVSFRAIPSAWVEPPADAGDPFAAALGTRRGTAHTQTPARPADPLPLAERVAHRLRPLVAAVAANGFPFIGAIAVHPSTAAELRKTPMTKLTNLAFIECSTMEPWDGDDDDRPLALVADWMEVRVAMRHPAVTVYTAIGTDRPVGRVRVGWRADITPAAVGALYRSRD